ncbi:hypothetical protein GQ600_399 [Phytophthora cactorum]|nr:hypothetical protein GQ600_399 [Phytophthora cactorum]
MLVNVGHLRDFTQKLFQPKSGKANSKKFDTNSNPTTRQSGDDFSIAKFSVFTTDWKYQDVTEGTFYRGDITNSTPFKWIVKS